MTSLTTSQGSLKSRHEISQQRINATAQVFFSPWFSYPTSRPLHHGWAFPVGKSRPFCFVRIWIDVSIVPRSLNLWVPWLMIKARPFKPYLNSTLHIFYFWTFFPLTYICMSAEFNRGMIQNVRGRESHLSPHVPTKYGRILIAMSDFKLKS